jgi:hypothetical protein
VAIAMTAMAAPMPMPADAPPERPLDFDDVEATEVVVGEDVGDSDGDDVCVCVCEVVGIGLELAGVEVAAVLRVLEVATMPVEKAGSLICIID